MVTQFYNKNYFWRTFLFLLTPIIINAQTQLGSDIDGEAESFHKFTEPIVYLAEE